MFCLNCFSARQLERKPKEGNGLESENCWAKNDGIKILARIELMCNSHELGETFSVGKWLRDPIRDLLKAKEATPCWLGASTAA
jgi:hypothetical protein